MVLILSHSNPTFWQVGPNQIGLYAFNSHVSTLKEKGKKEKKGSIQFKSSICFKWVPGIMENEPSLKVTLSMLNVYDP
jgi:hypothetical protein